MDSLMYATVPLGWYLALWIFASAGILWFGFVSGKYTRKELNKRDQEIQKRDRAIEEKDLALIVLEEELQEINHGYSTVALLLEEHTQDITLLQGQNDKQNQRINIINQRLSIQSYQLEHQEKQLAFYQENPESSEEEMYEELLPDWVENVKGLDQI